MTVEQKKMLFDQSKILAAIQLGPKFWGVIILFGITNISLAGAVYTTARSPANEASTFIFKSRVHRSVALLISSNAPCAITKPKKNSSSSRHGKQKKPS